MSDQDLLQYTDGINRVITNLSNQIAADKNASKQQEMWEDSFNYQMESDAVNRQTAWDMFNAGNQHNAHENELNRVFNASEAEKARTANTYFAKVRDALRAGLNPASVAGSSQQTVSASSGGSTSSVMPSVSRGSVPPIPTPTTYFAEPLSISQLSKDSFDASYKSVKFAKDIDLINSEIRKNHGDSQLQENLSAIKSLMLDNMPLQLGLQNEEMAARVDVLREQINDYKSQVVSRDVANMLGIANYDLNYQKHLDDIKMFYDKLRSDYDSLMEQLASNERISDNEIDFQVAKFNAEHYQDWNQFLKSHDLQRESGEREERNSWRQLILGTAETAFDMLMMYGMIKGYRRNGGSVSSSSSKKVVEKAKESVQETVKQSRPNEFLHNYFERLKSSGRQPQSPQIRTMYEEWLKKSK